MDRTPAALLMSENSLWIRYADSGSPSRPLLSQVLANTRSKSRYVVLFLSLISAWCLRCALSFPIVYWDTWMVRIRPRLGGAKLWLRS